MSARIWSVVAASAVVAALVACGSKGDRSFDSDTDPTNAAEGGASPSKAQAQDGGSATGSGSSPGVGYPDGAAAALLQERVLHGRRYVSPGDGARSAGRAVSSA